MNLGNLSNREKAVFILTIAIIGGALLFNLVFLPYSRMLVGLSEEISTLESKLVKSRRLISKKGDIEKEFVNLALDLKEGAGVSNEQQIAVILVELEHLGNTARVHIKDIKPQPFKEADYFSEFIVNLRIEAGMKEICNFLYQIQRSKELLTIAKLQLAVKSADSPLIDAYLEVRKTSF